MPKTARVPLPSGPSRAPSARRHSSRTISPQPIPRMPIPRSRVPTAKPAVPRSTTSMLSPTFCASRSVRASTKKQSASVARLMKILLPRTS